MENTMPSDLSDPRATCYVMALALATIRVLRKSGLKVTDVQSSKRTITPSTVDSTGTDKARASTSPISSQTSATDHASTVSQTVDEDISEIAVVPAKISESEAPGNTTAASSKSSTSNGSRRRCSTGMTEEKTCVLDEDDSQDELDRALRDLSPIRPSSRSSSIAGRSAANNDDGRDMVEHVKDEETAGHFSAKYKRASTPAPRGLPASQSSNTSQGSVARSASQGAVTVETTHSRSSFQMPLRDHDEEMPLQDNSQPNSCNTSYQKDAFQSCNTSFASQRSTFSTMSRRGARPMGASFIKLKAHWINLVDKMKELNRRSATLEKISRAELVMFLSDAFKELRTFFTLSGRPYELLPLVTSYTVTTIKLFEKLFVHGIIESYSILSEFVTKVLARFLSAPAVMNGTGRGWIMAKQMLNVLIVVPQHTAILHMLKSVVKQTHSEFLCVYGNHLFRRDGLTPSDFDEEFVVFTSRELDALESKMQERIDALVMRRRYGV